MILYDFCLNNQIRFFKKLMREEIAHYIYHFFNPSSPSPILYDAPNLPVILPPLFFGISFWHSLGVYVLVIKSRFPFFWESLFPPYLNDKFARCRVHVWLYFSFSTWKLLWHFFSSLHYFRCEICCHSSWCSPIGYVTFLSGYFEDIFIGLILIMVFFVVGYIESIPSSVCSLSGI